jgi:predicted membrane metal-binding protein
MIIGLIASLLGATLCLSFLFDKKTQGWRVPYYIGLLAINVYVILVNILK